MVDLEDFLNNIVEQISSTGFSGIIFLTQWGRITNADFVPQRTGVKPLCFDNTRIMACVFQTLTYVISQEDCMDDSQAWTFPAVGNSDSLSNGLGK